MLVAGAEVDLDAAGAQQVLVVEGNARAALFVFGVFMP